MKFTFGNAQALYYKSGAENTYKYLGNEYVIKAVDTDVEGVIGNITIGLDSTNYEHMTAKIEVSAENPEITVEPEEPTDPSDPTDPSEPGDKPAQDPEIVVPDTGSSDSNILIYVSLGVAALCALIIVIASKKKQNLGK